MARPKKTDEEKLTARLPAPRVTQGQFSSLANEASKSGMTFSDYIRSSVLSMANPDGSARLVIELSPTQLETLQAKADAVETPLSDFARDMVLSGKKASSSNIDKTALMELNRIGVNLMQITRALNTLSRDGLYIGDEKNPERLSHALSELLELMERMDP